MKQILILVAMMLIMVGPSMALNPAALIIENCEDYGQLAPLDADVLPDTVALTVPSVGDIYVEADGSYVFFVNPELSEITKSTLTFTDVDGFGHSTSVTVYPCAVEVPSCEYRFSDFDDNIQIGTPTIGQTVPVSWSAPGGNGDWSVRVYENGILNRGKWQGNYPIEVVASELDEDWIPTGYQIIDGICG
jgi:hypothetical protein